MNDLMKMLSELMSSEPAVSTRTQPAGQSILDLMTPDSVRYGSPANIKYGVDEYATEPMDAVTIFGNKSASADPKQAEFLLHELIHSGEKEGSKMSMTSKYDSHNEEFKKVVDKSLENPTLRDLLIKAMTGKNTDGNFLDMITR